MTENPPVPRWSLHDEADLLWYHGIGQTRFERSTFGVMLDRARSMATDYKPQRIPVLGSKGQQIGWESAITARPTAEQRTAVGEEPDAGVLVRFARISRLMMKLERQDATSSQVVSTIFGDLGARWAAGDVGCGRLGSLYHLTSKGRAIIDDARKVAGALDLSAVERIWSICAANRTQPKPARTLELAFCARQAEQLERRARIAWHIVRAV